MISIYLSFFLLFPRPISAVGDWMSIILPHVVWPQCEFRMHVWNALYAARWKYRTQEMDTYRNSDTRYSDTRYSDTSIIPTPAILVERVS